MGRLNGCPRCDGALIHNDEEDLQCLCCGWVEVSIPIDIVMDMEEIENGRLREPGKRGRKRGSAPKVSGVYL